MHWDVDCRKIISHEGKERNGKKTGPQLNNKNNQYTYLLLGFLN